MWGYIQKPATCKARNRALNREPNWLSSLILNFPTSRTVRNKCLFFLPPSLWCFIIENISQAASLWSLGSQNPERAEGGARHDPWTQNCSGAHPPRRPVATEAPQLTCTVPQNPRSVSLGWLPEVETQTNHRSHDSVILRKGVDECFWYWPGRSSWEDANNSL